MTTRQYKRDLRELELRRRRGMRMLSRGESQAEVARKCEVTRQTAMTWARRVAEDREAWRRKRLGRPAALDEADLKRLAKLLLDGATANGFPNELWTLARVVKLIEREFEVKYSVANVWHVLRALGFSSQRPAGRAMQRDEAAIKAWRVKRWPALKKSASEKAVASSSSTRRD
jgi:putative transposase